MIDHTDRDYAGPDDYTETTLTEGDPRRLSLDGWLALQANASQLHRMLAPGAEVWTGHSHEGQFFAAAVTDGGGALVTLMPRVTTVPGAPRNGRTQSAANDDGHRLRPC